MVASTTEAVLLHHGKAVNSGNMNMILEDYTRDSVLYIPTGTYRGLDGIKKGFEVMGKIFTPEVSASFKTIKQEIAGEYAYMLWSAPPLIPFAGDTFHIRNGKILLQSVIFQVAR